jgi:hypothetical protein
VEVRKIAEYLGKDLSDEQIKAVIGYCSLNNMKNSTSFKFLTQAFDKDFGFFCNAQIGNWQDYFTEDMSRKVDELVRTKLKYRGEFNYGVPRPLRVKNEIHYNHNNINKNNIKNDAKSTLLT